MAEEVLGSDDGDDFVEEEMSSDEATALDGSLTNDLVETQVGTVLKRFNRRPKMAYVQMAGRALSGKVEFQDQEARKDNERRFRDFVSEYDIEMPDVLGVSDEFVEFERVDGMDMNTYLNQVGTGEAEEMGHHVGEFLNYVHGRDGAITDLRINNFMIDYEGDLNFLDAEYFSEEATDWEKRMDLITLVSSLKQVDGEAYMSFREGFEESYSGEVDGYTEVISSATSPLHAALLERDSDRLRKSLGNIGKNTEDYRH